MESSNIEDLAARMYPSMQSTTTTAVGEPAAPAPQSDPQMSRSVSGDAGLPTGVEPHPDPEMQALREDHAERMYSRPEAERAIPDGVFDRLIGQSIEIDGQEVTFSAELAQKGVIELRAIAADLQLSKGDMAVVSESFALAQSFKGDEQKTIAARESAVELLNAQHGQEAALAARAAREFVARNPKLAQVLEQTGAGDAPQVVALVARRALALHKAGKLTLSAGTKKPQGSTAQRLYASSNMKP